MGSGDRENPGGRPLLLLDTNALLWMRRGDDRLGSVARREIERAWQSDDLAVSAISFWEVAMLVDKGRITLTGDIFAWRREHLEQGVMEIPIDGEIGIRAAGLPDFHADPADRPDRRHRTGRPSPRDVGPSNPRVVRSVEPLERSRLRSCRAGDSFQVPSFTVAVALTFRLPGCVPERVRPAARGRPRSAAAVS